MPELSELIAQLKQAHEDAGGFRLEPEHMGADFHVVAWAEDGAINCYELATEDMLDDPAAESRWRRLASADVPWMLLVPEEKLQEMTDLVENEWCLPGCHVLAYFPKPEGGGVEFHDLPGLPGVV